MKNILWEHYHLPATEITQQKGGWAAKAYRVSNPGKDYFLKVYDRARPSTAKWTALIDVYTPILRQLGRECLHGRVPVPVLTADNRCLCEDDESIYLLYEYIDGETIGEKGLTRKQVRQLADIIGRLHGFHETMGEIPEELIERFEVGFNDKLAQFLAGSIPEDIRDIVKAHGELLWRLTEETARPSRLLAKKRGDFVLCHTDVHEGNLMQTANTLVLIDWEGLKFAPREADFFAFRELPYYEDFLSVYRSFYPGFSVNEEYLRFYKLRRKSEDIWEFIEQLLYETLTAQKRREVIGELIEECEGLDGLFQP